LDDQLCEVGLGRRSLSAPVPRAIVFSSDELVVPAEQGVGRDDGGEPGEHAATEQLSANGEPPALIIGEADASAAELLAQDAILLAQVVDDEQVAALQPARGHEDQHLKNQRTRRSFHGGRGSTKSRALIRSRRPVSSGV
jgi:hypothetical protein